MGQNHRADVGKFPELLDMTSFLIQILQRNQNLSFQSSNLPFLDLVHTSAAAPSNLDHISEFMFEKVVIHGSRCAAKAFGSGV